jgi:hypothetical protein
MFLARKIQMYRIFFYLNDKIVKGGELHSVSAPLPAQRRDKCQHEEGVGLGGVPLHAEAGVVALDEEPEVGGSAASLGWPAAAEKRMVVDTMWHPCRRQSKVESETCSMTLVTKSLGSTISDGHCLFYASSSATSFWLYGYYYLLLLISTDLVRRIKSISHTLIRGVFPYF